MIHYLIATAFLLTTLILSLWASRGIKTMKDYALANSTLSTSVGTITLMATYIGTGSIAMPYYAYYYGINQAIFPLFVTISFLIVGSLIAPHMVHFQDCITIGDLMHKFYGKQAQILTGVIYLVVSVVVITAQLRAIGYINSHALGLSPSWMILGIGLIVVAYTSLSGMRGVAYTDVLQFIVMAVVMALLVNMLF